MTKKQHPLEWVIEPLIDKPNFLQKAMFGCEGCYFNGRLVLLLASRGSEPWNGLLIPTERAHHRFLMNDIPSLIKHSVIGKWLYLSEGKDDFEKIAGQLIKMIENSDLRIGISPKPKKRKKNTPFKG